MQRNLFLSLIDQIAVSGGNFLTIALGAHFLPIAEQGKLAYCLSAYMATVLVNVAAVFAVAPVDKHETVALVCYRLWLFRLQVLLAAAGTASILVFMWLLGARIGWEISLSEAGMLALFLLVQQFADFKRRSAYIFDGAGEACRASLWTYGLRVGLLIAFRPASIIEVLAILACGAVISVLVLASDYVRFARATCESNEQRNIMQLHQRLSFWSSLNAPLSWVCFFLPIFALGAIESEKAAAILASIRSIGNAANVALELLETIIPAWFAAAAARYGAADLKNASIRVLLVGTGLWLLGLLVILALGNPLIEWLLGSAYASHRNVLLVSWVGSGIHFVSRVVGLHHRSSKNTKVEFIGTIGGLLGLMPAIPIVDNYGIIGAAWAYVTVPVGIVVAQYIYLKRRMNV